MRPHHFIERGHVSIRYAAEGEGQELVALIHEMGGSLESWDRLVPLMRGKRILRFDMRGFGMTSKVVGVNDLDAIADDLAFLLEALGLDAPVHVAGMAVGAAAAVRFAKRHPMRLASLALAGPALGVSEEKQEALRVRADRIEREGVVAIAEDELGATYALALREAKSFDDYCARWLRNDPASYAATCRMLARLNMQDELGELRAPTLFLAGALDPLRPPTLVECYAHRVVNSRFETLVSGHVPAWQTPTLFHAALQNFWAQLLHQGCRS